MMLITALTMSASLHLTLEKWVGDDLVSDTLLKDTTVVVTEFEYDEDLEEAEMGVAGELYSEETQKVEVTVTRKRTGVIDQFCAAGECIPGNEDTVQVLEFTIGTEPAMRRWFSHYTPMAIGEETIIYTFDDKVNPAVKLTVVYNYAGTAVENVVVKPTNGIIYTISGQAMGKKELEELPAGTYIQDGRKIHKQ